MGFSLKRLALADVPLSASNHTNCRLRTLYRSLNGECARTRDETEQAVTEEELRKRLAMLRIEHRDLDAAINALTDSGSTDQLQIARLKKRKLLLRDQIALIEDQLIPDIIA
jgi:hypothetical protein